MDPLMLSQSQSQNQSYAISYVKQGNKANDFCAVIT